MYQIERIKCGNGNCFLISEKGSAILVDTSRTKYRDKILDACKGKNIKLIILTHGHVDHVQNAAFLSEKLNAPIAMHHADDDLSKDNLLEPLYAHKLLGKLILALSVKSFQRDEIPPFEVELFLTDGDTFEEYGIEAEIIELPGHTKGSIGILVGQQELIVGDALMNMSYPAKSMLYGNWPQVQQSADKISDSPARIIHFGHGNSVPNRALWK